MLATSVSRVEGTGGHVEEAKAVLAESYAPGQKLVEVTWQFLGSLEGSCSVVDDDATVLLRKTYIA